MFRTTFVKHSLAVATVASAIVLTAPAAFADEPSCGTPGSEAVWQTVVTEPTYRTVPEAGHEEWRWQREVTVTEATTELEFVHQTTGKVRWERSDWGAQNGEGKGWIATGASRDVPGTTEEETTEATSATAPAGDGWTAVEDSRTYVIDEPAHEELLTAGSEETVLISPAVPAGEPCEEIAIISDGGPRADAEEPTDEVSVAGPQAAPAPTTAVAAPAGHAATVTLPNTGGVAGWMAPVGLGAVLAGLGLVRGGRRSRA